MTPESSSHYSLIQLAQNIPLKKLDVFQYFEILKSTDNEFLYFCSSPEVKFNLKFFCWNHHRYNHR